MSKFDQTTERKSDEYGDLVSIMEPPGRQKQVVKKLGKKDFTSGRNSTKASMIKACRALDKIAMGEGYYGAQAKEYKEIAKQAIAAVKAEGNWPLEEK